MIPEKMEECPECSEVKKWLYDAQQCAACGYNALDGVSSRIAALEAERDALKARYDEEYRIVARVWNALGIDTFEQADGREISEIVADWVKRAEAAEAEVERLKAEIATLENEVECHSAEEDGWEHDLKQERQLREAAETDNAQLRVALEPFSLVRIERATEYAEQNDPWSDDRVLFGYDGWELTVGMVRSARQALSATSTIAADRKEMGK